MSEYLPEGKLISEQENINILHSLKMLEDAKNSEKILEAKACVCDSSHNLIVDLAGIKGIIPREEGAIGIKDGSVRDIAVISRVNRPVCFVVTDITEDENGKPIVMLSREKAQRKCLDAYISRLRCGDIVPARITHLENFGAFADIGCGIVALMPIDTISVSRIEHPAERFTVGMDIKAVIKSVENGRISLSHKELLGTHGKKMPKGFVPVKPCRELSEAWKTTVLLWSLHQILQDLQKQKREFVQVSRQAFT